MTSRTRITSLGVIVEAQNEIDGSLRSIYVQLTMG